MRDFEASSKVSTLTKSSRNKISKHARMIASEPNYFSSEDDTDSHNENEEEEGQQGRDLPLPFSYSVVSIPAEKQATVFVYPMNFFTKDGKVPKEYESLAARWPFRKSAQLQKQVGAGAGGPAVRMFTIDTTPFDFDEMKEEMSSIRNDLYVYASNMYKATIKEDAVRLGLHPAPGHVNICTTNDLKKALLLLDPSLANNWMLVYRVFLQRPRIDKIWNLSIVDNWAASNGYTLTQANGGVTAPAVPMITSATSQRKRNPCNTREGFGAICMEARKTVIRGYMRHLFDNKQWSISTTQGKRSKGDKNIYTKIDVTEDGKEFFYHVQPPSSNPVVIKKKTVLSDGSQTKKLAEVVSAGLKAQGKDVSADEIQQILLQHGSTKKKVIEPILPSVAAGVNTMTQSFANNDAALPSIDSFIGGTVASIHPPPPASIYENDDGAYVHSELEEAAALSTPPSPEQQQTVVYAEAFLKLNSPEIVPRTTIVAMESFTPQLHLTGDTPVLALTSTKTGSTRDVVSFPASTGNTRRKVSTSLAIAVWDIAVYLLALLDLLLLAECS